MSYIYDFAVHNKTPRNHEVCYKMHLKHSPDRAFVEAAAAALRSLEKEHPDKDQPRVYSRNGERVHILK